MKIGVSKSLVFLSLAVIVVTANAQDPNLESRIDAYLKPLIEGNNFSGSIMVESNGQILVDKGYGQANISFGIPNSSKTKFQIASLSKTFTAASVLMLEERGSLDISHSISKYIPELSNFEKVTIHHLLNHHSGIPDINRQSIYKELERNPQTPSTLIEVIKDFELSYEPGEKYSYSNSNYNILAALIEVVSEQDYGTFLYENIFQPLGMMNSGHHANAGELIGNLATGYVPAGGYTSVEIAPYLDWSVKTGNGSLYSTTVDLLKWINELMGGRVLSKASVDKMLSNKYGWFVQEKLGEEAIYINGNSPGFSAYLAHFPEKNLVIIVLGNNHIPLATSIGDGIAGMIIGHETERFESLNPIDISNDRIRSIVGTYKFPYYTFELLEKNRMIIYEGGYPNYQIPLIPLGEDRFFNRFFWTSLIMERDSNGMVTHACWEYNPNMKGERIIK